MRPRRRARPWSLALLVAMCAAIAAPADAGAARGFTLATPKLGDLSGARVELRSTGGALAGMRLRNPRALPRTMLVAGRLTRVGRSNRYIARVFALYRDPGGRATVAAPPRRLFFEAVGAPVIVPPFGAGENAITEPDIPPELFLDPNRPWRSLRPLLDRPRVFRPRLAGYAHRVLSGLPVPDGFDEQFDTNEVAPAFGGVHSPFEGSRFEHVFQLHGNTETGSFTFLPPDGGTWTACAGAPCVITDQGIVIFLVDLPAGQDIEVNARSSEAIPRTVQGEFFPGAGNTPFNELQRPRRYQAGVRLRF